MQSPARDETQKVEATDKAERSPPLLPLREMFGLDLRSLALLRVGLAVLLLLDWIDRIPDLRTHFTDEGVVPREVLDGFLPVSIQLFSGALWFQAVIAAIAVLAAVAMLIGWQTPLATFVSWLLLIGAHGRNPAILQGGDMLLRLLLLWGMFLPLGARWSIDGADPPDRPTFRSLVSVATVVYILQLCLVYLFASAWKWAPEWRSEGTAVYETLGIACFTTRFGYWLREQPELCRLLTYTTLALETLGPVLLFLPFSVSRQRMFVIASFLLFHAGLAITLELGNFPWVCWVAWLALLPTAFWDKLAARLVPASLAQWTVVYDPRHGRVRRVLAVMQTFLFLDTIKIREVDVAKNEQQGGRPAWEVIDPAGRAFHGQEALRQLWSLSPVFWPLARLWDGRVGRCLAGVVAGSASQRQTPVSPEKDSPSWAEPRGMIAKAILVLGLIYIGLWNVRYFNYEENRYLFPDRASQLGWVLGLEQGWGLFAPRPGRMGGWYLVIGTQRDGTEVDLFKGGGPVDRSRPKLPSAEYPNGRWRKLIMNLPNTTTPWLLPSYAKFLYREWNRDHHGGQALRSVEIIYMKEEMSAPDAPRGPVEAVSLIRYEPQDETP